MRVVGAAKATLQKMPPVCGCEHLFMQASVARSLTTTWPGIFKKQNRPRPALHTTSHTQPRVRSLDDTPGITYGRPVCGKEPPHTEARARTRTKPALARHSRPTIKQDLPATARPEPMTASRIRSFTAAPDILVAPVRGRGAGIVVVKRRQAASRAGVLLVGGRAAGGPCWCCVLPSAIHAPPSNGHPSRINGPRPR